MKKFIYYFKEVNTIYDESKMLDKFLSSLDDSQKQEIQSKFASDIELIRKKKLPVKATIDKMKRSISGEREVISTSQDLISRISGVGLVKEDKETIASFLLGQQQANLIVYDKMFLANEKTRKILETIGVKPSELADNYKAAVASGDPKRIEKAIDDAIKIFKGMDKIEGWVYNGEPVFPVSDKRQSKRVTEKKSIRQADLALEKRKKEILKSNQQFRDKILYPALSREIATDIKVISKTGREREIRKDELDDISSISLQDAIRKFWKVRKKDE